MFSIKLEKYKKEQRLRQKMNKFGKIDLFTLRIIGAVIGSIGFFLIAYQKTILGTALIGIGSVLIAAGGG